MKDIRIALDRIGARITWQVSSEDELRALHSAVNRGEFGRARILEDEAEEQRAA